MSYSPPPTPPTPTPNPNPIPLTPSPSPSPAPSPALSLDDVRKIARLARLELSEAQLIDYQHRLSAVLTSIDTLRVLDTSAVEPMTAPVDLANALAPDSPADPDATLPTSVLMSLAVQTLDPFVKVPRVISASSS